MNTCDVQAALLSLGHPLAQFGADGETRAAMLTFKRKRSPAVTDKARGHDDSRAPSGQDPATANVRFLSAPR